MEGKLPVTVTICITHYMRPNLLYRCVETIKKHTKIPYCVFITNQGWINNITKKYLDSLDILPNFKIFYNKNNVGHPKSKHDMFLKANTKYIVSLDDDIVVSNGWLKSLVNTMDEDKLIGAASSILLDSNKRYYQFGGGRIIKSINNKYQFQAYLEKDLLKATNKICDYITSGCCIYRQEAIINGVNWDPKYFVGAADLDLSMQLKRDKWKMVICTNSTVLHLPEKINKNFRTNYYASRFNQKELTRSKNIFFHKWGFYPQFPRSRFNDRILFIISRINVHYFHIFLTRIINNIRSFME